MYAEFGQEPVCMLDFALFFNMILLFTTWSALLEL